MSFGFHHGGTEDTEKEKLGFDHRVTEDTELGLGFEPRRHGEIPELDFTRNKKLETRNSSFDRIR